MAVLAAMNTVPEERADACLCCEPLGGLAILRRQSSRRRHESVQVASDER